MNTKKVFLFLLINFFLSWSIALVLYFIQPDLKSTLATVMLIVYMYMPALAAFIVQKLIYKQAMVKPLLISFKLNWFFLWALLLPMILVFLATGIGFLFPGVHYSPEMTAMMETFRDRMTPEQFDQMQSQMEMLPIHPIWLSIIQGLIAAVTINALAGFGEELGWRGFLLTEFRTKKFVYTSLVMGFIWGIWHAPIILMGHNYPEHSQWGVLFMTIFCVLYTFLFNYITLKARSVIAAAIMHGSVNAFFGITLILSNRTSDLLLGITGIAGFITLILALIALYIYDQWISKERIMSKTIADSLDAEQ